MNQQQVSVQDSGILTLIEKLAINDQVDVSKLEKLLDMQERIFNKSAEIEFNSALANVQSDLPVIKESGKIIVNNEVRSTYAKIEDIIEASAPILKANGFGLSFKINNEHDMVAIKGILVHKGGHREETVIKMPTDRTGSKNAVQSIGSTIKYGKRYVMCALLNIATHDDPDDDGNGSQTISVDQVMNLAKRLEGNDELTSKVLAFAAVDAIHMIPSSMYESILNRLGNTNGK